MSHSKSPSNLLLNTKKALLSRFFALVISLPIIPYTRLGACFVRADSCRKGNVFMLPKANDPDTAFFYPTFAYVKKKE
jgi:hypothetical protein